MSNRPRITVDANCTINLFDTASETATSVEALTGLVRYAMEAKVEIAATTRLEADLLKDKDEDRRKRLLRALNLFPIISTIGRWDTSRWDTDVWVSDATARLNDEIQQILSPGLTPDDPRYGNKINDIDHLTGHVIDRRDIFVTDDGGILKRREQLRRGPGIVVMTPAECLAHINEIELRKKPRTLPTEGINPDYHARSLVGTVTFDYSNNQQRYAIGEGQYLFETQWGKASNTSIYALHDAPSVDALALAKGAGEISEILAAESYDFSSRHRTPTIGQIVIWRNLNGFYAATKIVGIKDDSRGDDHDELTFEYVILPDGGTDFRKM